MELLKGKVAVVTGGTRGIGYQVVETFLSNGARVALLGSRQDTVDKALEKLRAENAAWEVIGYCPDLSDYPAVEACFADVVRRFGALDILVNNAGISAREPLADYTPEAFEKIMNLNVNGVFCCSKAAAAIIRRGDPSEIAALVLEGVTAQDTRALALNAIEQGNALRAKLKAVSAAQPSFDGGDTSTAPAAPVEPGKGISPGDFIDQIMS